MSQPVCKEWLTVLQATYIVHLLKPFYNNFGKRIIKTPKLYFYDSAIVAFLTRQPNDQSITNGAMAGSFFEGFIIIETQKILSNSSIQADLYFWRSHDGLEVDLLMLIKNTLYIVEVELTATPTLKHAEPIRRFKKLLYSGSKFGGGFIVCNSEVDKQLSKDITIMNWRSYFMFLKNLINE